MFRIHSLGDKIALGMPAELEMYNAHSKTRSQQQVFQQLRFRYKVTRFFYTIPVTIFGRYIISRTFLGTIPLCLLL